MLKSGTEIGKNRIEFVRPGEQKGFCSGEYLSCHIEAQGEGAVLYVGMGKKIQERNMLQEIFATAAKSMKSYKIREFSCDMKKLIKEFGANVLTDAALGLSLGFYEPERFPRKEKESWCISLTGTEEAADAEKLILETYRVAEGIMFARDMVNRPANMLRPYDFAAAIREQMEGLPVEVELLGREELEEKGMGGILSVGGSSAFPPCLLLLRYIPDPGAPVIGLAGKGVTLDTGGYCLKNADSMGGIKGDMAGGAAVAGAVYAMAANRIQRNVTAAIPMAENRIAPDSSIPGDVITCCGGTTVEILNTDAEGRLLLADAVSCLVRDEGVERVLDIATLTGAVCTMFGNCAAGAITDNEEFYHAFVCAAERSGERFARIPWFREQEDMIKSTIADIRNTSADGCGTITAGLFIRRFTEKKPWIHLDIAGMASGGPGKFAYYADGGTGFGVSTMYYLCKG